MIAIDGGSGEDQLTTRVPVNISIADVNNKLPRLLLLKIYLKLHPDHHQGGEDGAVVDD